MSTLAFIAVMALSGAVGSLITYMLCAKEPPVKEGAPIVWPTIEG